jgi:hypothetical protein
LTEARTSQNLFLDPKSSESLVPYFSNAAPDTLAQRQVLRTVLDHWADSDMVERIYVWTWDARPYPAFPQQMDVWSDGANHATGHWLEPLLEIGGLGVWDGAGGLNIGRADGSNPQG